MREHYQSLIDDPEQMDKILRAGADKARELATPFMRELRHAVGLRSLSTVASSAQPAQTKLALPSFKQYREKDGRFYFKMVDAKGQTLLQSLGFTTPKEAGQAIARLQTEGAQALPSLSDALETLSSIAHQQLLSNLELLTSNHGISQK